MWIKKNSIYIIIDIYFQVFTFKIFTKK